MSLVKWVLKNAWFIILSNQQTYFDASAEDNFWNHCCNFSFSHLVFNSNSIFIHLFKEIFHIFAEMFLKLSASDLLQVGKGLTILQQPTLNIICQNIENLYTWMDNPLLKVVNIVAKGQISCFEQFLLLSIRQKASLWGGKGFNVYFMWYDYTKEFLVAWFQIRL